MILNYRISSVKSQMRAANKSGAKFVMIIGEEELKKREVTLKNMQDSSQEMVAFKNVAKILKGKL